MLDPSHKHVLLTFPEPFCKVNDVHVIHCIEYYNIAISNFKTFLYFMVDMTDTAIYCALLKTDMTVRIIRICGIPCSLNRYRQHCIQFCTEKLHQNVQPYVQH